MVFIGILICDGGRVRRPGGPPFAVELYKGEDSHVVRSSGDLRSLQEFSVSLTGSPREVRIAVRNDV